MRWCSLLFISNWLGQGLSQFRSFVMLSKTLQTCCMLCWGMDYRRTSQSFGCTQDFSYTACIQLRGREDISQQKLIKKLRTQNNHGSEKSFSALFYGIMEFIRVWSYEGVRIILYVHWAILSVVIVCCYIFCGWVYLICCVYNMCIASLRCDAAICVGLYFLQLCVKMHSSHLVSLILKPAFSCAVLYLRMALL